MKRTPRYLFLILLIWLCIVTPVFAETSTFSNPQDSYVRQSSPTANYGGDTTLIADGVSQDPDNGIYGEVAALLQWNVSTIPASATVTFAKITLNLTNPSSGDYDILEQLHSWDEYTVNWTDLSTAPSSSGTISAGSSGAVTFDLNNEGLALVQGWVDGSIPNNGVAIRTQGTNNGIRMDSKELGRINPILKITYTNDGSGPPTNEELLARIQQLEALLAGVSRQGNTILYEGVNLQVVNGLGATNGNPDNPDETELENTSVNGLGNLIVGYNEDSLEPDHSDKTGSHNVVIGHGHIYTSFGGIVTGLNNTIKGQYSSIGGGTQNIAEGISSHISGGSKNSAVGLYSSVLGGDRNRAGGDRTTVSGGWSNAAGGSNSSVSGGEFNRAVGWASSVSGGYFNDAHGSSSSISGGETNRTYGDFSSISGGSHNAARGDFSSVSGGNSRSVIGENDWQAGSLFEDE